MRILLANFSKMVGDTGGAAKVNVAFANEMVRRGHTVITVYTDDREGAFFYPPDARATVIQPAAFSRTPLPLSDRPKGQARGAARIRTEIRARRQ